MAAHGARLILVDLDIDRLRDVKAELEKSGAECIALRADVTVAEDVAAAIEAAAKEFGSIDILVNCAGATRRMPAEEFNETDWDFVINTNLKGTYLCCREAGKHMLKNGGGSIINITSLGAHVAIWNSSAYCASKGGVAQLTKTLALEWAKKGVRVNAISPGVFETPLLQQCIEKEPDYAERMLSDIPLGRFGKPEELVGTAVYLASNASSYVTSHLLIVDGGFLLH